MSVSMYLTVCTPTVPTWHSIPDTLPIVMQSVHPRSHLHASQFTRLVRMLDAEKSKKLEKTKTGEKERESGRTSKQWPVDKTHDMSILFHCVSSIFRLNV